MPDGLHALEAEHGSDKKRDALRDDTLVPLLIDAKVPLPKIEAEYPEVTSLVRILIGLVPHCDSYLEIWPKAFKSYNLIVPNFMNVPFAQFGLGPGYSEGLSLQGLGMYVVSRAAECPYCSAHTCSYALRRGVRPEALAAGYDATPGKNTLNEAERATVAVARSLGRVPCELSDAERFALRSAAGDAVAEAAVFAMCGMGYLNKVMDSIGVELEEAPYLETRELMGSDAADTKAGALLSDVRAKGAPKPAPDSLCRKLQMLPLLPAALRTDAQYTKGVPNTWPAVGDHLKARLGCAFPVLASLSSRSFLGKRVIVALATVLIDNYDDGSSIVTVRTKILAGAIFARFVRSAALARDFDALAAAFTVDQQHLAGARALAEKAVDPTAQTSSLPEALATLDNTTQCWLLLARAIVPSPAEVSSDLVRLLKLAKLDPQGVVELVNFMAVTQLLYRLSEFFQ